MVAMPNRWSDQDNSSNFVGAEEVSTPIRVPARKLPQPGRKMSFREAMEASIKRNHELYKRLD